MQLIYKNVHELFFVSNSEFVFSISVLRSSINRSLLSNEMKKKLLRLAFLLLYLFLLFQVLLWNHLPALLHKVHYSPASSL